MTSIVGSSKIVGSAGALVVCGLSAAIATGNCDWPRAEIASYSLVRVKGTKSPVVHVAPAGSHQMFDDEFPLAIADFYKTLLDGQEPLGREFEDIWEANLENLYEA